MKYSVMIKALWIGFDALFSSITWGFINAHKWVSTFILIYSRFVTITFYRYENLPIYTSVKCCSIYLGYIFQKENAIIIYFIQNLKKKCSLQCRVIISSSTPRNYFGVKEVNTLLLS